MTLLVIWSEFVELGADEGSDGLIKTCQHAQALQVRAPVEGDNGLRRDNTAVQKLHGASYAHGNVVLVVLYAKSCAPLSSLSIEWLREAAGGGGTPGKDMAERS